MRFLARLVGALLALVVDLRRVKCTLHVPSAMTWPTACANCGEKIV